MQSSIIKDIPSRLTRRTLMSAQEAEAKEHAMLHESKKSLEKNGITVEKLTQLAASQVKSRKKTKPSTRTELEDYALSLFAETEELSLEIQALRKLLQEKEVEIRQLKLQLLKSQSKNHLSVAFAD
jgi:hypothetical protein